MKESVSRDLFYNIIQSLLYSLIIIKDQFKSNPNVLQDLEKIFDIYGI